LLPPSKEAEHIRVSPSLPFRPGAVPFEYVIDVDEDDLLADPES